ncbi:MAG: (d)CMP kinase [Eubacteriales bacterium]
MQIAIDGPSGAGKSSVAKSISDALDILHLDTGAMYRTLGYKAMQMGIDTLDEKASSELVENIDMDVLYKDGTQHMILDGKDITEYIREPQVSINASNISKHKRVREKMVEMQREIAKKTDVVVDGRDIGTYVLPDADFKFYITASTQERAKRRHMQLLEKGVEKSIDELEKEMSARDYQDMNREFAPLKAADDAMIIDTTEISMIEVVEMVLAKIKKQGK